MSVRELVVLGTASRVPTRHRNHNGYLLRWDGRSILFDPGEGMQRQFTFAGISPAAVTDMCITHFHGDHCLGLAGMIQRLAHEQVTRPVHVAFPASGAEYVQRLRTSSIFHDTTTLTLRPLAEAPQQWERDGLRFDALPLDHKVPTMGYRVSEPDGVRFLPDQLAAAGVRGPDVARLQAAGEIRIEDRTVRLAEVSVPHPGASFAFVMDTRPCANAVALARGASLAVIEATFLECHADLADKYGHTTAAGAARLAQEAGVDRLVLSHFSQRYAEPQQFLDEAVPIHPDTVLANDLDRIPVPKRAP